jgi:hypothetical protein
MISSEETISDSFIEETSNDSTEIDSRLISVIRTARPSDLWIPWHRGDELTNFTPYKEFAPSKSFLSNRDRSAAWSNVK